MIVDGIAPIRNDSGNWLLWQVIDTEARVAVKENPGYRYWQAVYNLLFGYSQDGLPSAWPELFYCTLEYKGMEIFLTRMEIIDGYIVPIVPRYNVPSTK